MPSKIGDPEGGASELPEVPNINPMPTNSTILRMLISSRSKRQPFAVLLDLFDLVPLVWQARTTPANELQGASIRPFLPSFRAFLDFKQKHNYTLKRKSYT